MPTFTRLIRFEDPSGQLYYGDAPETATGPDLIGSDVQVNNDPFGEIVAAKDSAVQRRHVSKLLSPIPIVAHIYGVGLNYKAHAVEASVSI
jgi:hypothetical protein